MIFSIHFHDIEGVISSILRVALKATACPACLGETLGDTHEQKTYFTV